MNDWHAYLPAYITSQLINQPTGSPVGSQERFEAVTLFADIAGFTSLSESLAAIDGGAEQLTLLINQCFAPLIAIIHQHGGVIINFGGDAITALFPLADESLDVVSQQAVQCASAMQAWVGTQGILQTSAGEWRLTLKIGLAAGEVLHVTAGDPQQRLLSIVTGTALLNCAQAQYSARSGDVIIHVPSVGASASAIEPLADANFARIRDSKQPLDLKPTSPRPNLDQATVDLMAAYLHPSIAQRLRGKQTTFINERRNITLLFVEFQQRSDLDSANVGEQLVNYFNAVLQVVQRYDGYINKVDIGDKGNTYLVIFGAPLAHENDADRAAHCALELRAIEYYDVSIGINTGFVFCGLIGSTERQEYTVIGDVVNVASRLMQAAKAGQILLTTSTQEELGDQFLTAPLPAIQVKGKTEPIELFELTDLRQRGVGFQEPVYVLPMVGRTVELGLISEKMQLLQQHQGQVVAIIGEAGMGKSRLAAEIRRIARAKRIEVYAGECVSYGTNSSYLLWHNLLRAFFNVDPNWRLDLQLLQLRAQLALINPDLLAWIPLMASALRLPIDDDVLVKVLDVRSRKMLLESLLSDCVRFRARETPLLFILEDCHWIDPLSLDLLNHLVSNISDVPLMIVLLYRPPVNADDAQWLNKIKDIPNQTQINLHEFDTSEAAELIRLKLQHMFGNQVVLPDSWVHKIAERAQGNPFYIEELINLMIDDGLDLQNLSQLERLDLPDSLHRLIISRIDQLDEGAKTTLKVASVIGRLFKARWLWGAYPQLGSTEAVISHLETLSRMDLTPLDRTEPEREYLFKHVITQEVAYQSLPFTTRSSLHEQIAQYLEQHSSDTSAVDTLVHHYSLTSNRGKQREYFLKAAKSAEARFANEVAISYYQRLLPLLELRDAPAVLMSLGSIFKLLGRWDDANRVYQQVIEYGTRLDLPDLIGKAFNELSGVASNQGLHDQAIEYSQQSELYWDQAHSAELALRSLLRRGWVYYSCGRLHEARDVAHQMIERAVAFDDYQLLADAYVLHGYMCTDLGDFQQALFDFQQALKLAQDHQDNHNTGRIYNLLGEVARASGDHVKAVHWYEQALVMAQEIRHPERIIMYTSNLGGALVGTKEYARAIDLLQQALEISETVSWYAKAETCRFLAEAYAGQRDYANALAMLDQSLKFARLTQMQVDLSLAYRTLGKLWHAVTPELQDRYQFPASAQACFETALNIQREAKTLAKEARTLRDWGQYEVQYGDPAEGQRLLAQARAMFVELKLDNEVQAMDNAELEA